MRVPRPAAAAALLVLLVAGGPAGGEASREGSGPVVVVALAVAEDAEGTFVGVHATVEAQVLARGSGDVFVSTKPLAQTDMQGSARLAARVAAATLGADVTQYDFLVSFRSGSTVIGGPSAGAVMTLALTAALHNLLEPGDPWELDPSVAATGTINPDGTVGPVGGIPAKAEGARDAGIDHFLYPAGLDVATTQERGRAVTVDMAQHCAALGITCSPAASLVDLLQAAGIDVVQPAAPVPGTTDYREDLEPSVAVQVQDLQDRLDALRERLGAAPNVDGNERAAIGGELALAETRLEEARAALGEGRFYLAATRSFQGHIQAGRAENLTTYAGASNNQARLQVVQGALAGCRAAVDAAAAATDGLEATGLNALYAIGSAQQRVAQARGLLADAEALAGADWPESLFASAFCVERAGTAAWWADLRDTFGAGPGLGDRAALVEDALEAAREEVAYASAVLGDQAVAEAAARLAAAQEHANAGRGDAAILEAIEAQTAATVAMQTASGPTVPEAVLAAAEQSASRAIDTARSRGVEPMLSVSLVELSQDQQESTQALANLWSARSLALLDRAPTPAQAGDGGDVPTPMPIGADGLPAGLAAMLVGAAVGGGLVAVGFVLVLVLRRP